jgi:hypothetical protein
VFSGANWPLHQNHRDSKLGRHRELNCGDIGQHNRSAVTPSGFRAIADAAAKDWLKRGVIKSEGRRAKSAQPLDSLSITEVRV